jgi:hypothetical protein
MSFGKLSGNHNILVILMFILALYFGCDTRNFNQAKKQDTRQAYLSYLESYPDGRHKEEALERLDQLAFAGAQDKDTIEAYRSYLAEYPGGRQTARADERIEELRAGQVLDKEDVDAAEAFLADYPDSSKREQVREHLVNVLKKLYSSTKEASDRQRLEEKIKNYGRSVFLDVNVKSWLDWPYGYQSNIRNKLESAGFSVSDDKNSAHILVKVNVWESKGEEYLDDNDKHLGYSTNISASISIHHLILNRQLFKNSINYEQPFFITIFKPSGSFASNQTHIYNNATEEFQQNFYYEYLADILRLFLDDAEVCGKFYLAIIETFEENPVRARYCLNKSKCQPETDEHRAAWAIATGNKKECVSLGKVCADAVCKHISNAGDYMGDSSAELGWLTEIGEPGINCLCQMLEESIGEPFYFIEFRPVLRAMEKVGGQKALECMEKVAAQSQPDYSYLEDEYMEAESREQYKNDIKALKNALKRLREQ